jgi:hypothetical protein
MKRLVTILFLLLLSVDSFAFNDSKITQVKGIILICESKNASKCDDRLFSSDINTSPIKFISRQRFDDIIEEQKLSVSGMTKEENAKIGLLLNASHFLFYTYDGTSTVCTAHYNFKLVSTSTSEIECIANTCECTDSYREKLEKKDAELREKPWGGFLVTSYCSNYNVEGFFKFLSDVSRDDYIKFEDSAPWRKKTSKQTKGGTP